MAKIDIDKILKQTATGFKSDIKDYSLLDLESILYGLKIAIDSADNDEKMENKISSFIDTVEKHIKRLSDIKKKNSISAEDASANLASILGFGVKPQQSAGNTGRVHTLDGNKPKKSITTIANKITPTKAPATVVAPVQAPVEVAKPTPAAKPPKPNKTSKSGQFLLFGFEPKSEEGKQEQEQQSVEIKNDKQMSLDFNKKVKKEKSKSPSEALLLRARAISLKEAQLEETKRRHTEVEKLEREHLSVRNKESLRINQREKDASRVRLEVANIELEKARLKTEAVKDLQEKKIKSAKSIQTSKARVLMKREELKAESAEKRAETAKEVKLAQLKYKEHRDEQKRKDAQARREEREEARKNKLKGARRDKVGHFLHEMSPTIGYSYKLATGGNLFGKTGGVSKAEAGTGSSTLDSMWKMFFSSGAGAAVGPKIGKSILGSVKGVGKIASKGAVALPGIGGLISGISEYSGGSSLAKSVTVGAGAASGVAIGAAAGAFLGPVGALVGGLLGGFLGESGARDIFDMLTGNMDKKTPKPLPSQQAFDENAGLVKNPDGSFSRGNYVPNGSSNQMKFSSGGTENNVGNLKNPNGQGFQTFGTQEEGFDAVSNQIGRYVEGKGQWKGQDITTIQKIVDKYRPKSDWRGKGDITQEDYYNAVAKVSGFGVNEKLPATKETYDRIAQGMVKVETGKTFDRQSTRMEKSNYSKVSERLAVATEKKDQAEKAGRTSPQPVSIINGGNNVGGNTTNTTIINAPETDSFIRQMSYLNMKTMAPAQ